ncbi:MAG: DUF1015 domain-containing protein [Chloroflexi bacterium]|nr:DUF1015 domain-containing protein [Chloroflexota bacterium]
MSRVRAFRGVRYATTPLAEVVSPPYDVISPAEQRALEARSPLNAVYLELPEDAPGEPNSRYRLAAERWRHWRETGDLVTDAAPGLTFHETTYQLGSTPQVRSDLLATVPVEPWEAGAVLPHERTMAGPKADRLALLQATEANVSPIWLLHAQQPARLDQRWHRLRQQPPDAEFALANEQHRLWIVDDAAGVAELEEAFASEVDALYVADGHHRYETALAYRRLVGERLPGGRAVLAVLTWAGDPGLLALPTHRLLRHLDPPLTLDALASDRVELTFLPRTGGADVSSLIAELHTRGRRRPTFGAFSRASPDRFGLLEVRAASTCGGEQPLDVALLHDVLVDPLVEGSVRPRAEVLSFTRDPLEAMAEVERGGADLAFFLNPTPVARVLEVAAAGARMPEKSTYFAPKPPTGLVMRDLRIAR